MIKRKYALRFPEIEMAKPVGLVNLYSEQEIQKTGETFRRTFDMMHSLADYVIQKNRTYEMRKQLDVQREALNAHLKQAEDQERIALVEYSKRLKLQLKEQKESLELELKMLAAETSQKVNEFSLSVEETLRASQLLLSLIRHEQELLDSFQPYLNRLKGDYTNRREYSQYCDMQRRAYERINGYLKDMI